MNLSSIMLAPLALILPVAGGVIPSGETPELTAQAQGGQAEVAGPDNAMGVGVTSSGQDVSNNDAGWPLDRILHGFSGVPANQVRIEQRMTIRIIPQPAPVRRDMFMELPSRQIGPRFEERKIGKCLPVTRIAGVQANGPSGLILYMRDQRIVSAQLERACRSRDFYSGFYLSRASDGKLCVDRDTLQSRSGANCKLTRIRQLVEVSD